MSLFRRIALPMSAGLFLLFGCGGGGGSSAPVIQAPTTLAYSTNPAIYTKGTVITANSPSNSGGAASSYSVAPPLPVGLNLSTISGVVSGTPTVVAASAAYIVTATNGGGSTTASLNIIVNDVAPSNLAYSTNTGIYIKGAAIIANTPSNSGGSVVSYSVSPTLPAGLSLNAGTGSISGTPTAVTAAASYTVTATNSGGATSATLSITINEAAPSNLTYSTNPVAYTKGTTITVNSPSNSGGAVVSYAVIPALPLGLSLSMATGVVTGTPTAISASTPYTVTASNITGNATVILLIAVNDVPPSNLAYSATTSVYTKGTAITSNSATNTGGTVTSYSVSPSLPAGLSLNTTTGVISGTPTVVAAQTTYTVTASNSGGNATIALTITVKDVAPANLTYTANTAVYTKGTAIASNTPSNSGGTVVSYGVSPSLPAGLSLSTSTGAITGTPTAVAALATYTVTATNSGGSTTASLTITVNDVAPSSLAYGTTTAVYTKGTAIANNSPSSLGGAVVSYGVSPSLPAGLSLSTSTGAITGTPTAITALTTYTVTATNSGGSTTASLTITVNDVAPSSLAYGTSPAVYTKGTAIASNTPSNSGGTVVSYGVSPSLPAGLSLSTSTGAITGAPTAITASAAYTVTATNSGGSTTASVTITVNDAAPSSLAYGTSPAVYTKGTAIASNTPSNSGGTVVSYGVSPSLPAGLSLSTSTGAITGAPTAITALATYTVTATNSGGSTTTILTLTVNDVAPSISYGSGSYTFTTNFTITAVAPTNTGGSVVTWSMTPSLPTGLSFNTTNGSISGTPTAITAPTAYTVTATNTGGSCAVSPILQVNPPAPTITAQPINRSVAIGQSGTFSIAVTGSGTLSCQWFKNGTNISGATSVSYTTPLVTLADNGANFSVVVSDIYGGSATSTNATLTVIQGAFSATGSITGNSDTPSATTLSTGDILVIPGGAISTAAFIYNPSTGTFAATGPLTTARINATTTLLANGQVLVIGGISKPSAELYDPNAGIFTATGSMAITRWSHTATLLPDGKVLVTGGAGPSGTIAFTAEIYDPSSGTFSTTGSMGNARLDHTATLLTNGKVLIAGGYTKTAELFNPATGVFSITGSMSTWRSGSTAKLLPNGKVLIAGGNGDFDFNRTILNTVELYDPTTEQFSFSGSMIATRSRHSASLLMNGNVLIAGGIDASGIIKANAEIYNCESGTFAATGSMGIPRQNQASAMLMNGLVLVVGGSNNDAALGSAELYDPQDLTPGFPTISFMPQVYSLGVSESTTVTPSSIGTTTWSITPVLFAGLSLNTTTGIISGTPTTLSATQSFKVTASNGTNATSTFLWISVITAPKRLNHSYVALNGMTVTVTQFQIVDSGTYYTYNLSYRQDNATSNFIDEASFKLYFTDSTGMPQYGFFNRIAPGGTLNRTYQWQEIKSKTPNILEYDANNFFTSTPASGTLQWRVPVPN